MLKINKDNDDCVVFSVVGSCDIDDVRNWEKILIQIPLDLELIIDLTHADPIDIKTRREFADMNQRSYDLLVRPRVIVVAPSRLTRGLLMAIGWMTDLPYKIEMAPSLSEAIKNVSN